MDTSCRSDCGRSYPSRPVFLAGLELESESPKRGKPGRDGRLLGHSSPSSATRLQGDLPHYRKMAPYWKLCVGECCSWAPDLSAAAIRAARRLGSEILRKASMSLRPSSGEGASSRFASAMAFLQIPVPGAWHEGTDLGQAVPAKLGLDPILVSERKIGGHCKRAFGKQCRHCLAFFRHITVYY